MRWNNFLPFCCFDLLIYFAVVLRVACTIISCFWWIKLWAVLLYFVCWFYVVHLFQNVDGDEWWPAYLRMNMIASVQSNSDLLQVFSKKKRKKNQIYEWIRAHSALTPSCPGLGWAVCSLIQVAPPDGPWTVSLLGHFFYRAQPWGEGLPLHLFSIFFLFFAISLFCPSIIISLRTSNSVNINFFLILVLLLSSNQTKLTPVTLDIRKSHIYQHSHLKRGI